MAFQPILNLANGTVFAQEALVRGTNGEGAGQVLGQVSDQNRYAFDQTCRVKAIELAAGLKFAEEGTSLSINFLPNAVYEPRACIRLTLATAMKCDFPLNRIIFEFTETEKLDTGHLLNILRSYRAMGFQTAIDDFGSGYAGLGLLSKFQPDLVKIDMELIRDIDTDGVKRTILSNSLKMLNDLNIRVICEGIETVGEFDVLRDMGVELMQGYLLGRPSVAALTPPAWPHVQSLENRCRA
ncbi:EAL domain-containing protein [Asticcacaulis sp. EMRT-3]|uniref:EAL domain-containing protein n=1 Tax=Asticcacaulis sp. EMRT-3 TaxID=3040349 RepID=UPI0024AEC95F|nr:EAL domain-containing protein [Asticcacaulis sp. EMRT-3]MDI7776070.1 EAL domain-containing protein [Asticcacaulis sp. EMRT-3]